MSITPGEWKFARWVLGSDAALMRGPQIAVVTADERQAIALTGVEGASDEAETIANAQAIAALPELLAAARAVLFQFTQGDQVFGRDACVSQLHEAYLKAKGTA